MNVLVADCGGGSGVDTVRALRRAGHAVTGTAVSRLYLERSRPDSMIVLRDRSRLLELAAEADVVIAQSSAAAIALLSVTNALLPSEAALAASRSKVQTKTRLREAGVPTTEECDLRGQSDVEAAIARFGLPLWVRAPVGCGGAKAIRADKAEQARLAVACSDSGLIAEPFLPGKVASWCALYGCAGALLGSVSLIREEFLYYNLFPGGVGPVASVSLTTREPVLRAIGEAAILALGEVPRGFATVDMRQSASGDWMVTEIELGCPFPSTDLLAELQIDFPSAYCEAVVGMKLELLEPEPGWCLVRGVDCEPALVRTDDFTGLQATAFEEATYDSSVSIY